VTGRELRLSFQPFPKWLFTLKFDYLPLADFQKLVGFYNLHQGSLSPFLFLDPTDYTALGAFVGTGDGVTTQFFPYRYIGSSSAGFYGEPIQYLSVVQNMYLDGVNVPGTWAATSLPPAIYFNVPPNQGQVVTGDFLFYFVCRFADDTVPFENFMLNLWSLKEIKLQSVLL
jgi:uncharacterized protein (TIGR02217 family)